MKEFLKWIAAKLIDAEVPFGIKLDGKVWNIMLDGSEYSETLKKLTAEWKSKNEGRA